jgi:hypothetical protein
MLLVAMIALPKIISSRNHSLIGRNPMAGKEKRSRSGRALELFPVSRGSARFRRRDRPGRGQPWHRTRTVWRRRCGDPRYRNAADGMA